MQAEGRDSQHQAWPGRHCQRTAIPPHARPTSPMLATHTHTHISACSSPCSPACPADASPRLPPAAHLLLRPPALERQTYLAPDPTPRPALPAWGSHTELRHGIRIPTCSPHPAAVPTLPRQGVARERMLNGAAVQHGLMAAWAETGTVPAPTMGPYPSGPPHHNAEQEMRLVDNPLWPLSKPARAQGRLEPAGKSPCHSKGKLTKS